MRTSLRHLSADGINAPLWDTKSAMARAEANLNSAGLPESPATFLKSDLRSLSWPCHEEAAKFRCALRVRNDPVVKETRDGQCEVLAACEGDDVNLSLQYAIPEPKCNDGAGEASGFLHKLPSQLALYLPESKPLN